MLQTIPICESLQYYKQSQSWFVRFLQNYKLSPSVSHYSITYDPNLWVIIILQTIQLCMSGIAIQVLDFSFCFFYSKVNLTMRLPLFGRLPNISRRKRRRVAPIPGQGHLAMYQIRTTRIERRKSETIRNPTRKRERRRNIKRNPKRRSMYLIV